MTRIFFQPLKLFINRSSVTAIVGKPFAFLLNKNTVKNMEMTEVINYIFNIKNQTNEKFIRERPTLVEIRSNWSGGSHLMDLITAKIELEYNTVLNIVRIDFEAHKELFNYIGIEKAPAFLVISNGNIINIIKETVSKKSLENIISNLLSGSKS
jgi:thioredoxin-like negative regulator of GroEL